MKRTLSAFAVFSIILLFTPFAIANAAHFHHYGIPISNADKNEYFQIKAAFAANEAGETAAAREIFGRLFEKNPKLGTAKIGLILTATSNEDYDEHVTSALKMNELSAGEKMIIDNFGSFLKRDLDQFVKNSGMLVKEYPNSSWAWRVYGSALQFSKQINEARNAFDRAMLVGDNDTLAFRNAANSYMFNEPKDFDKAQLYIEEAIKRQPSNPMLYIALGDAYRARNELQHAQINYEIATTVAPRMYVAHTKQGHANTFLGNYEKARENYNEALKVGNLEDSRFNSNFYAYTYIYEGKPEKALDEMSSRISVIEKSTMSDAVKLDAKASIYSDMALVALHYNMLEEAKMGIGKYEEHMEQQFAAMTEENSKNSSKAYLHFLKGIAALKSDDKSNAIDHANMIKKVTASMNSSRKNELYHELMGHIEMQNGNNAEALAHLHKANENDMYVKYHIAKMMDEMGEDDDAVVKYTELGKHNFNDLSYALVRNEALKSI